MQQSLSADERVARARLAVEARWAKRFDWVAESIEDCQEELATLRSEMERGGLILQKRISEERLTIATCYNPECRTGPDHSRATFDISRAVGGRTRISQDTGQMETAYACSAACYLYLSANFHHHPGAQREPVVEPVATTNEPPLLKV